VCQLDSQGVLRTSSLRKEYGNRANQDRSSVRAGIYLVLLATKEDGRVAYSKTSFLRLILLLLVHLLVDPLDSEIDGWTRIVVRQLQSVAMAQVLLTMPTTVK